MTRTRRRTLKTAVESVASLVTLQQIKMRPPKAADGARIHALIAACPPLDGNSLYANLLQCTHFAETCILAEAGEEPVGWISAYRPPENRDVLFVWQVAVSEEARGMGLAKSMLLTLLKRPSCDGIRTIHTTITPENEGSWKLFKSVARALDAALTEQPWFLEDTHFAGRHATEHLVTIGPVGAPAGLAGPSS